jgi:thioredoxin 2
MLENLLVRCTACGALNRVPVARIERGEDPACGRCKVKLAVCEPAAVTDASFADEVERSEIPVLVDMWAEWCGPCRYLAPIVDQIAHEMAGRVRVLKLNVDENPATASRFDIRGIPALLIFKNGREVDRIVGAQPKSAILRRLEALVQASSSMT